MSQSVISVIIPVYNMEKYLKRCIDSVINQTFRNLEIILINDGSTDSSGRICDDYKAIDNRIIVVHKKNEGVGLARNNGINIATGNYISFIDNDDYISLDMYEKLYNELIKENADSCIYGYYRIINNNIKYTRLMSINGTFSDLDNFNYIFLNTLGSEPAEKNDYLILWQSACFCLFSLEIIKKNNLLFPSDKNFISEDHLFIIDYFYFSKKTTILNEALYYYCLNETSFTKSFQVDRFKKCLITYFEQLRRIKIYLTKEDVYNIAKQRLQRGLLANARNCIFQICEYLPYNKESLGYINEICNDQSLKDVLKEYPWKKNPLKYRIFNYFLYKKKKRLLYLLAIINK